MADTTIGDSGKIPVQFIVGVVQGMTVQLDGIAPSHLQS